MKQFALATILQVAQGLQIGPSIVEVSSSFNSLFPFPNFNRNVSVPGWETSLLNGTDAGVVEDLEYLANASFISYDPDFYQLLGVTGVKDEKQVEVIFTFPPPPASAQRQIHDGSVYIPETRVIFFVELYSPKIGFSMQAIPFIWQIQKASSAHPSISKAYPEPPLTIANGAYYHKGVVYWAQEGNYSVPGGVVRMDVSILATPTIQNNFYGHRLDSPNDIVVSDDGKVYFPDGYYGRDNFRDTLEPELANGVYRWDMDSGNIRMVAGAADGTLFNPNGLAFNAAQAKLFVFAYVDSGFPDGVKTVRDGRFYAAVTGSVEVFDINGTLLGRIKVGHNDVAVNMEWVENWVYIFGRLKVYRVELTAIEK